MPGGVHRIQRTGGSRKTDRGRPVGGSKAERSGVQIARTGITGEGNGGPELQGMPTFGPGEIVQQVMRTHLEVVAIGNALVQPQKRVPRLVATHGTTYSIHAITLPRVSPTKGIRESGAKNGGVTQ